jgi:hypothetical protein
VFIFSPKKKKYLVPMVTTLEAIGDLPPVENGDKSLAGREYYRAPFSAYQVENVLFLAHFQVYMRKDAPDLVYNHGCVFSGGVEKCELPTENPVPKWGPVPNDLHNKSNYLFSQFLSNRLEIYTQKFSTYLETAILHYNVRYEYWKIRYHTSEPRKNSHNKRICPFPELPR